ncbi:hypothetical protein DPEC_G00315060 [Dallia pectoralis]|uniref:Uncharacterized protein n=1 Tax=Dallia pectoralis TaxID=75939 RepID=A0ACC2FCD5_DALPE|nr:hypothetical protein DPEC_G00315060 [Dallia pectoralis]
MDEPLGLPELDRFWERSRPVSGPDKEIRGAPAEPVPLDLCQGTTSSLTPRHLISRLPSGPHSTTADRAPVQLEMFLRSADIFGEEGDAGVTVGKAMRSSRDGSRDNARLHHQSFPPPHFPCHLLTSPGQRLVLLSFTIYLLLSPLCSPPLPSNNLLFFLTISTISSPTNACSSAFPACPSPICHLLFSFLRATCKRNRRAGERFIRGLVTVHRT